MRKFLFFVPFVLFIALSVFLLSGLFSDPRQHGSALVERPAVLLLDELTTFLDGADQMNVLKVVRNIVTESGITAVWVTHRLEELRYADAVSYMDGGGVVWTVGGEEAIGRMRSMGAYVV